MCRRRLIEGESLRMSGMGSTGHFFPQTVTSERNLAPQATPTHVV
jgi:hypothetical protein